MKNIFSIIFTFILIFILFYSTILIKSVNKYEKPNFQEINLENTFFEILETWEIKMNSWDKTKVKYFNNSDKILSFSSEFKSEEKNWLTEIILEKWFYVLNINSINKKYFFKYEENKNGFNLETNGANSIFIDTTDERIKILSIDNIIKIDFIGEEEENWQMKKVVFNSIYLYPNQYISFFLNQISLIKDADLLKLTQNLSFNYFNGNIIEKGNLNPNFKKSFLSKDEEISKTQENLFKYISKNFENKEKEFNEFLEKKFFSLPWERLMLEYSIFLFNKEKKIIYTKNQILKDLQQIFKNKQKQSSLITDLQRNIETKLEELKNLSKEEYEEMKKIINYFSGNINLTKKEQIELVAFYAKFTEPNLKTFERKDNLELNSTYFKYNFITNKDFFSEIKNYIESKNKIEIDKNEKNFFIFFLNEIILSNLKEKNINFEDTINIFKNYSKSAINYYSAKDFSENTDEEKILKQKIIETGITNFNKVLTDIIWKIENNYFTYNSNNLLEPIKWKNISRENVEILANSIDDIFANFYQVNINLTKNAIIRQNYIKNWEKFEKLKLALTDYEGYLVKNDKKIDDLKIRQEIQNNDYDLNIIKARNYLKKFKYVSTENAKIEIMWRNFCDNPENEKYLQDKNNPTCYKITWVTVWNGNIVDFLLFPNDFNKVSNIVIGWDKNINKWTYKLDDLEESLAETWDEKYNFENIFINTIIPSNSVSSKVEFDTDSLKWDTPIIRTLKNTNLLWKNWTLTKLNEILEIWYNNVLVTESKDGNDFIIKIENATINVKTKDWNFKWSFKSDYKYKVWNINSFFNPEIQLQDWNTIKSKIKMSGFIELEKFIPATKKLFSNAKNIQEIEDMIMQKDNVWSISIVYFPSTNKFQLTSKNIKIIISEDQVETFTSFWKNLLEKKENLSKIKELFNNK